MIPAETPTVIPKNRLCPALLPHRCFAAHILLPVITIDARKCFALSLPNHLSGIVCFSIELCTRRFLNAELLPFLTGTSAALHGIDSKTQRHAVHAACLKPQITAHCLHGFQRFGNKFIKRHTQLFTAAYLVAVGACSKTFFIEPAFDKFWIDIDQFL